MKYCWLSFLLFIFHVGSHAQSTSDCGGAIQLCGGIYSESTSPTGTGSVYEFTGTCNANLETSSIWYTFTVAEAGNISFILDPTNNADDYDWGMFNITNGGCAGINAQNGTSPEVACNSYGLFGSNGSTGISTAAGGTGVSNGPGNTNGPAYNADLPVQVGETYALVVMNWSNSPYGYTIDFTESTASIFDSTTPEVVEALMDCSNTNIHLLFSEPMTTSTVEPADFTLTNSNGAIIPFVNVVPDQPSAAAQTGFTIGMASAVPEPGLYTLNITSVSENVEDICGNVVVDTTLQVRIGEPLRYEVQVSTACNALNGAIQVEHTAGGVAPITFALEGQAIPNGQATGLNTGTYTLTVTDGSGCEIDQDVQVPDHVLNVTIAPVLDSLSCAVPFVTIDGATIQPAQTVQYAWTALTENGTNPSFSTSPAPTATLPGTYTLLVTHAETGCTDAASVQVHASAAPTLDLGVIMLPNVVSPNGDGQNDVWRPFSQNDPDRDITSLFDSYALTIFNRWGQVMHDEGTSRSWNPRDVATGTYYYEIAYRAECGTVVEGQKTGTIMVLH